MARAAGQGYTAHTECYRPQGHGPAGDAQWYNTASETASGWCPRAHTDMERYIQTDRQTLLLPASMGVRPEGDAPVGDSLIDSSVWDWGTPALTTK